MNLKNKNMETFEDFDRKKRATVDAMKASKGEISLEAIKVRESHLMKKFVDGFVTGMVG